MPFSRAAPIALLLASGSVANAQDFHQLMIWCNSDNNAHAPALQIRGCTGIIQSGRVAAADLAVAFNNRGLAYDRSVDHHRAITDYGQAIKLSPRDARYRNNRCYARVIVGHLRSAFEDCNAALILRPDDPTILDSRGFVHFKLRSFAAAIADFNAAHRKDPKLASSLYLRGIAKLRLGEDAAGRADISAAKSIKEDIADEFARYGVRP